MDFGLQQAMVNEVETSWLVFGLLGSEEKKKRGSVTIDRHHVEISIFISNLFTGRELMTKR